MRQRQFVLGGLVCALALTMVACGSSSHTTGHAGTLRVCCAESWAGAKHGGVLTVYDHEDFQHLDPGQTYFGVDYPVVYATQTAPVHVPAQRREPRRSRCSHPVPRSCPTVSAVTVHLKRGVNFSPPVNREVTSSDVAYAIERA